MMHVNKVKKTQVTQNKWDFQKVRITCIKLMQIFFKRSACYFFLPEFAVIQTSQNAYLEEKNSSISSHF